MLRQSVDFSTDVFFSSFTFTPHQRTLAIYASFQISVGELWRCITFFISYALMMSLMIMSLVVDRPPPEAARVSNFFW